MCLGVAGKVLDVGVVDGLRMGRVDFDGVSRMVCLEHVEVVPGDYVLVHVGFALTKLAPEEASSLREGRAAVQGEPR